MPSSLGLAGDLDDVELIKDVEEAFGYRFFNDEVERCSTVGHLFELVEMRLPDADRRAACASAMCFYRLRRALRNRTSIELRPTTPIDVLGSLPVRMLYQIIKSECGLRPPVSLISIWGCIALLLVAAIPIGAFAIGYPWWIALMLAGLTIALFRITPIRLPNNIETFGDLVKVTTSRSIGALSEQGARLGPSEAWTAFKDILSDHTLLPKSEIAMDTLLLAPESVSA